MNGVILLANEEFFLMAWFFFVFFLYGTFRVWRVLNSVRGMSVEEKKQYVEEHVNGTPSASWILHPIKCSLIWGFFGIATTIIMIISLVGNIKHNSDACFTINRIIIYALFIVVPLMGELIWYFLKKVIKKKK